MGDSVRGVTGFSHAPKLERVKKGREWAFRRRGRWEEKREEG